jgi:hypothetical protein
MPQTFRADLIGSFNRKCVCAAVVVAGNLLSPIHTNVFPALRGKSSWQERLFLLSD